MTPTRVGPTDALIAAVLFLVAAVGGGVHYARAMRSGPHPFFYQSYFEPAVMTACGKGFLITQPQPAPPALRAFLDERTDRFSCDQLPANLRVGAAGLYQRPWRYLMTSVAGAWMLLGISWSGLAPFFGALFGTTTALVYGVCRAIVGRIAAAMCSAVVAVSSLQLANLPNLRDYAKAPFMVALLLILVALVARPWRRRDVLLLATCYGLVMGVGYGFRTDLLVDIPPFLIAVAFFLPGGVLRNIPVKIAAVACFAAAFVASGWPIITTVVSSGGCQWHAFLLGLTTPFTEALGVKGGAYNWGHLYNDEYMWATVSSYATRFRPDLGYIEYCSREYDAASWEYVRHILLTFPADLITRAYASALHVVELPLERFGPVRYAGPLLVAAFVVAAAWSNVRLALFSLFVVVYFCGYPAIQFMPRHYFPLEFIGWLALAWTIERAVGFALAAAAGRKVWPPPAAHLRRSVACAAIAAAALALPLGIARWYQNDRVTRLLDAYVAAPAAAMTLESAAPGQLRLPSAASSHPLPLAEAIAALGRARARFVEVAVDAGTCRPGTRVTFRYDPRHPETDFSRIVALKLTVAGSGPTRLFEPVYPGFIGLDVSDPSMSCRPSVSAVADLGRFPLLLSAQLPPGWRSHPQYQQMAAFE